MRAKGNARAADRRPVIADLKAQGLTSLPFFISTAYSSKMFDDGRTTPTRYIGPLTPAQAAAGINAANRNAKRLAADARLLFDAGRYPSAASLAALAIEEAGKAPLIRLLLATADEAELRRTWQQYRSHRSKNGMWILPALARGGASHIQHLGSILDPKEPHTAILDSVKQLGFYSDCLDEGLWSEPEEVLERPLAEQLVRTAEGLAKCRDVTVRELELWAEIVIPKNNTPEAALAVVEWQRVMFEEGLSGTTPEEMAAFILPDPVVIH